MVKNKCNHKSSWQIYKVINFSRRVSEVGGRKFKCSRCGEKCVVKWKGYEKLQKSFLRRVITYFLWLLPAFILIALVSSQQMNAITAIGLITLFHIISMIILIMGNFVKISKR